jgi:hypothetical protein
MSQRGARKTVAEYTASQYNRTVSSMSLRVAGRAKPKLFDSATCVGWDGEESGQRKGFHLHWTSDFIMLLWRPLPTSQTTATFSPQQK